MADELLCTLISASEKASKIARLCREKEELFSLLIQEKGQRNNEIDFKTFADVFIQQIVIKEVTSKFGKLGQRVQGEEDNLFTNSMGETIAIEISSDAENTANLLSKILQHNENAAKILANAAHETTSVDVESLVDSEHLKAISSSQMNLDNIGMWVDPIDCTSQYVLGIEDASPTQSGIYEAGLQCVLVLIGVYDLDTGIPVMGVVNQPFHECEERNGTKKWKSRCIWGFSCNGTRRNNVNQSKMQATTTTNNAKQLAVISLHDPPARTAISQLSETMNKCAARGAGYKCLTVIDHLSDMFVYTFDGSYKWDTCAPHAILLSSGGGIAVLDNAVKMHEETPPSDDEGFQNLLSKCQVKYIEPTNTEGKNWKANHGGLIAYSSTGSSISAVKKVLNTINKTMS